MKRFLFLILFLLLIFCGCNNQSSNAKWGSFTAEKTFSYDKQYYAVQEISEKDDMRLIDVKIYSADNTLIGSFQPARANDFWGICWEKDSYNIWVQSGDVGVICYSYDNEEWTVNTTAVRPDYIISKYDDIT